MHTVALTASYLSATASVSPRAPTNFADPMGAADEANLAQVPAVAAPVGPLLDDQTMRSLLETIDTQEVAPRVPYAKWLADNLFAEIKVKGEVVARVFRGGGCSIFEGWSIPADFSWDGEGIELAKRRAYQLAKFYDGTINGVDPDQARKRWLDMSDLEDAIGKHDLDRQADTVRIAVPTEAVAPCFAEED